MLASITPLGERGRGSRWAVTVSAFAVGAAGAGLVLGAGLGELGALVVPDRVGAAARLAVLAVVLLGALVLDTVPPAVPGPRRQVDPRWLEPAMQQPLHQQS